VALRPEIRELVLLFAQQAARDFLAADVDSDGPRTPTEQPDAHDVRSGSLTEAAP
jgi:hypothetical protein